MTAKSWLSGESGLSYVVVPLRNIPVPTEFGEMCNRYTLKKVLGQGAFGKVEEVVPRENERLKYACKTISADNLYQLTEFEKELNVAAKLEHPYIVKLHEAFKGKSTYHLVMTLCTGGDLESKIDFHRSGFSSMSRNIPVNVCLRYWWQMMAGCAYMHHHKICHRDIKAQNYMLETFSNNSPWRLIDFGVATSFTKGKPLTNKCGTLCYMAPEVFNCSYDQKCDVWSIGVTMYYAFSNHLPFLNPDQKIIVSEIQTHEPQYTEKAWQNVPDEAKKLLGTLLRKVPNSRPSARKVIQTNEILRKQRKGEPLGGEDGCCCCIQ
jgi:calcium-dependent protein kinase